MTKKRPAAIGQVFELYKSKKITHYPTNGLNEKMEVVVAMRISYK